MYELTEELQPGGDVLYYDGDGDYIDGLPTRNDLINENDNDISIRIKNSINVNKPVLFMPNDIIESVDYSEKYPIFILKIFGILEDGSKTEVNIRNVDVFFD